MRYSQSGASNRCGGRLGGETDHASIDLLLAEQHEQKLLSDKQLTAIAVLQACRPPDFVRKAAHGTNVIIQPVVDSASAIESQTSQYQLLSTELLAPGTKPDAERCNLGVINQRINAGAIRRLNMDLTTLLIIVLIVLLLGGGFYGRGRWY